MGKGTTTEKPKSSRDKRGRTQDTHQGQRPSGSVQHPRSGHSGGEPTWDEQQQEVDDSYGGNYTYQQYDPANPQAGDQFGSPAEYETPPKPHSRPKEHSRSKPTKGSESSSKPSLSKPKDSRPPKAATQTQQSSGEYYGQGYENSGYPPPQDPSMTGLETDIAHWSLRDTDYGSGGAEGWEGGNQGTRPQAVEAQLGDDGEVDPELGAADYLGEEPAPDDASSRSNPWEVKMNFRTRKQDWGVALGLIDTGNRVGPMILSQKVWALGYSLRDIDVSYMIEFRTIAGAAKTAGCIKLQYRTSESDGQCVEETFHVLANSFVDEYDAYLTSENVIPGPGKEVSPLMNAFSSYRRKLTEKERKVQMELLSRQQKGAKHIRDKAQESQARQESRGGEKGGKSSSRRDKGDKQTSASHQRGSYDQVDPTQAYEGYDTMAAGHGTYPPDYGTQYSQAQQAQVSYPPTGFEHGFYQQEGYQQEGYQQEGYQQEYQQGVYQHGEYQQGEYQQTGHESAQNQQTGYEQGGNQQPTDYPPGAYSAAGHYEYSQDQERRGGGSGGSKKQSSGKRRGN